MIAIVLGTRPEIIKMSPIIRECEKQNIPFIIIHTGQHYSYEMDRVFFEELELPGAQYNLDVGAGKEQRVIDMANAVNKLTGNPASIRFVPRRDWDVKTRLLSCINKAENKLGYKPMMKFEDGLKQVHTWFEEHWKNIEKSAEFS